MIYCSRCICKKKGDSEAYSFIKDISSNFSLKSAQYKICKAGHSLDQDTSFQIILLNLKFLTTMVQAVLPIDLCVCVCLHVCIFHVSRFILSFCSPSCFRPPHFLLCVLDASFIVCPTLNEFTCVKFLFHTYTVCMSTFSGQCQLVCVLLCLAFPSLVHTCSWFVISVHVILPLSRHLDLFASSAYMYAGPGFGRYCSIKTECLQRL